MKPPDEPTWSQCASVAAGGGIWLDNGSIESLRETSGMTVPSEAALLAAKAAILAKRSVPAEVTSAQFRIALERAGITQAQVVAAIGLDGEGQTLWEYTPNLHRDHPMVISIGAAMGKTEAEIDAIFIEAATL